MKSYQKSGFLWPKAAAFDAFFNGLIQRLEGFDISRSEYRSQVAEIKELQTMLKQSANGELNDALRNRVIQYISRLVDWAPGIDIRGVLKT